MNKVSNDVSKLVEKYSALWNNTQVDLSSLRKYSFLEKKTIQKQINQSINTLISEIKKPPLNKAQKEEWQFNLKTTLRYRAKTFLKIESEEFEKIMIDGCTNVAETFIDSAKAFNKNCKAQDIAQAIRNVWIMNIIQAIAYKEIGHTPSVFAYSMLYPCTDNYLDNPDITADEKINFNNRLKLRLEGEKIQSENDVEKQVYELVSMIESQYPRDKYPDVFDSIISIHKGQCKSLYQQNSESHPNYDDILKISIEKGGTSVLADAYLVCGNLGDELSDLMFGFGFVLQLIDDLQDTLEDYNNNHMTIFSSKAKDCKLDDLTNKLITFTVNALDFESYDKSPYTSDIKKLIVDNSLLLLFEAIWKNRKLYSRAYIRMYKHYTPYNHKFLNRKTKKLKKEISKVSKLF